MQSSSGNDSVSAAFLGAVQLFVAGLHPGGHIHALLESADPDADGDSTIRQQGRLFYFLTELFADVGPLSCVRVVEENEKFLSPDLLSWKDHALWHSEPPLRAEWRLELERHLDTFVPTTDV